MNRNKKTTVKDVAEQANVSIATVSHVINKTRYVGPELVKKVQDAIEATGYVIKQKDIAESLMVGKDSVIVLIIPDLTSSLNIEITSHLNTLLVKAGYHLSVHLTNDNIEQEKIILQRIVADKNTAGIILAPASDNGKYYKKIAKTRIPFVCIERKIANFSTPYVYSSYHKAVYNATQHLINSNHRTIALFVQKDNPFCVSEKISGYKKSLKDNKIFYRTALILQLEKNSTEEEMEHQIQMIYEKFQPSAIIACENNLTYSALKTLQNIGKECPQDLSIIGIADSTWCEMSTPPITVLRHNSQLIARKAVERVVNPEPDPDNAEQQSDVEIDMELIIRKSTRMIGWGPFGEKAVAPDGISLSEREKKTLREGNFRVAISFHYGGNAWTRLHEDAIKNTLGNYGISVVSVMDAQFDPALQLTQLEAIQMQKPDALIAIPTDDKYTAEKFKELAKSTKLVFMSNIPEGLAKDDYVSCVSVNEKENGTNAGILLGEYLKHKASPKVGFLIHGTQFYGTHLRDSSAERVIRESYGNIEIMGIESFGKIEHTYDVCKKLITRHPEIEALYISWDQPALSAIKALEEMNRTDISIFTCDLDYAVASYMARKQMIMGLSTQKPYEQGQATALAVAKSLVSNDTYKYIAVQPYTIKPKQLLKAWKEIMHEPIPGDLEKMVRKSI